MVDWNDYGRSNCKAKDNNMENQESSYSGQMQQKLKEKEKSHQESASGNPYGLLTRDVDSSNLTAIGDNSFFKKNKKTNLIMNEKKTIESRENQSPVEYISILNSPKDQLTPKLKAHFLSAP